LINVLFHSVTSSFTGIPVPATHNWKAIHLLINQQFCSKQFPPSAFLPTSPQAPSTLLLCWN